MTPALRFACRCERPPCGPLGPRPRQERRTIVKPARRLRSTPAVATHAAVPRRPPVVSHARLHHHPESPGTALADPVLQLEEAHGFQWFELGHDRAQVTAIYLGR